MKGVVINAGGVCDWASDDVFIVDFSEINETSKTRDPHLLMDVIKTYNSFPRDIFPDVTFIDLSEVVQDAVENLSLCGYRSVWHDSHIEVFKPNDPRDYGEYINSEVDGGYAVYDPKENNGD